MTKIEMNKKFEDLILELNTNIVCGLSVGSKIKESSLYEPNTKQESTEKMFDGVFKIGNFNKKEVFINVNLVITNIKIYDTDDKELIDLEEHGFDFKDLL